MRRRSSCISVFPRCFEECALGAGMAHAAAEGFADAAAANLNSAPRRAVSRKIMGGTKKKSMAQMEKEQESRDTVDQQGQPQKGKKAKEQKGPPQQQKRLPFLVPKMSDEEMVKSLTPLKAITVFAASRALGVNASIATGVLKSLEGKNLIARVGGFSGHYVWTIPQKS